jgi:vacuolar-type H+-ATPase subunit I/STV1
MEPLDSEALKFRSALRIVSTLALLALLLFSIMAYQQLPRVERIFEDMLGSMDKIPALPRMMFAWGQLKVIGLGTQFLVGMGAMICAFSPSVRIAGIGAAGGIVLLALHVLVCALSMVMPLIQTFRDRLIVG